MCVYNEYFTWYDLVAGSFTCYMLQVFSNDLRIILSYHEFKKIKKALFSTNETKSIKGLLCSAVSIVFNICFFKILVPIFS